MRDIPEIGVKKGDLGGYVEKEENLSHSGTSWIRDNAVVCDNTRVWGNAVISETNHVLTIGNVASKNLDATLYRTNGGYHLKIGCWDGSTEQLRTLADSNKWPSGCDKKTRALYRPQLHAIANLCEAHIQTWE